MTDSRPIRNRVLNSIAADEVDRLRPHFEFVTYPLHESLIKPHETIRHVVFPETCLASLVTVLQDGSTVEGGSVGREGIAGVSALLDADTTPMETLIQVAGDAIRVEISVVKNLYASGRSFRSFINRYVHTLFIIASQSAACNRKHVVVARLARWLLVTADGIGRDEIGITHEFLATMLGVRRSGVTEAAQVLQEKGVIQYKRAGVRIIDRPGLEAASCECSRVVKNEYARLFE